ncbi:hypothetical protein BGZ68_010316 [Mortierella alpina]|nr:hypothetical protein BGZ68_010316 [Mortierella alpina]
MLTDALFNLVDLLLGQIAPNRHLGHPRVEYSRVLFGMPLLSRVLHPASKRKPPIGRHGSKPPPSPQQSPSPATLTAKRQPARSCAASPSSWRRKSGCARNWISQSDQSLLGHMRPLQSSSWSASSGHAIAQPATFSDLYPVFRHILESRKHGRHHNAIPTTCCRSQSTPSPSRLSRTGAAISVTVHPQLAVHPWRSGLHSIFDRRCTTPRPQMATSTPRHIWNSSSSLSSSTTAFHSTMSTSSRFHHARGSLPTPIPSRRISFEHSIRTVEDVTDMRIPEEFLPIESTKQSALPTPSTSAIKKWAKAQTALARQLFLEQNYMQALVVVDKAKEHEYLRELAKYPDAVGPKVLRWHVQDLSLVEYCCRLLSAHETQVESLDMVDTLRLLNASVLDPAGEFKTKSWAGFWSEIEREHDPMVNYTLAILSRSWNQLFSGTDCLSLGETLSPDQRALASAIHPFAKALVDRQLLPSTTSVLQDLAEAQVPGSGLRRTILEICILVGDHGRAARWAYLWNQRDHQDWMYQWQELETKPLLTGQLLQSKRPDLVMDLFRFTHKSTVASYGWLGDFLTTVANSSSSSSLVSFSGSHSLAQILQFIDMDRGTFVQKKELYEEGLLKRPDLMQAWLTGLLDGSLSVSQQDQHPIEKILWRELAMVGVVSRDISRNDVLRSLSREMIATVSRTPPVQHPAVDHIQNSYRTDPAFIPYRDALTDHLDNKTMVGSVSSVSKPISDPWATSLDDGSLEGAQLLKHTIQELMSRDHSKPEFDQSMVVAYRDLLHNVAYHTSTRLGHLGLISLVSENRFRSLHGADVWDKTVTAVNQKMNAGSARQRSGVKKMADLSAIQEVTGFADKHLSAQLAEMCAMAARSAENPLTRWTGQFSDWYMAVAGSSERTKHMARSLHFKKQPAAGSYPYTQAMQLLLDNRQYDLAAMLHSQVYDLGGARKTGRKQHVSRLAQADLGRLIHALTTTSSDPKSLEMAQWIVDRHLEQETQLQKPGADAEQNPTTRVLNAEIATMLAGGWSRRAEFSKVRHVTDTMQKYGVLPSMVFYNTLLKALIDLSPFSKYGRRTMGSGSQVGMRELGREMMVQQMLISKNRMGDSVASEEKETMETMHSELRQGWDLFQSLVAKSSRRPLQDLSALDLGLDSPLILKELIAQTRSSATETGQSGFASANTDGLFRPDAFTFSILLGAFARRGEIEPISDLFVEMKQLGLEPDTAICTILANAFAKKGDLKKPGIEMDAGLYLANVVLDGLVEGKVSANKIRESLDRMIATEAERDDEVEISVPKIGHAASFLPPAPRRNANHLSTHHHHQPHLARASGSSSSSSGSKLPGGHDLGVDAISLTTVIKYHARQGDLQSAQDVYQTMLQAGFVPDSRVYALLLGASIRKQDIAAGLSTIRAMRTHSMLFPDAKAWKGLLRCALDMEQRRNVPEAGQQRNSQRSVGGSQQEGAVGISSFISEGSSTTTGDDDDDVPANGLVQSVLKELSLVLLEIKMAGSLPALKPIGCESTRPNKDSSVGVKDYLSDILTSSWVSLSDKQARRYGTSVSADGRPLVYNPEVKGQNGLLRRLLDHLLQGSDTKVASKGRGRGRGEAGDKRGTVVLREPALEVWQRCDQAIWLVRMVEANRIDLGDRWKWDIVVRRVHSLTGESTASIVERLNKRRKD